MSRLAECPCPWLRGLPLCVLALGAPFAGAQTIADYSRAQRNLLENTMTQAAARSAGLAASASVVAASMPAPPVPPVLRVPPAAAPEVQVSGVFASQGGAVAEVIVNATAYLLAAGQGVPGTAWRIDSIAVDRVVLGRHGDAAAAGVGAEGLRKVFALPALR